MRGPCEGSPIEGALSRENNTARACSPGALGMMGPTVWPRRPVRFLDLVHSAVAEHQKAKVADEARRSVDTNLRVVPFGHLVALFEIVNDAPSS